MQLYQGVACWHRRHIGGADQLRDQATRLLTLAFKARETGLPQSLKGLPPSLPKPRILSAGPPPHNGRQSCRLHALGSPH
jgi:hypothetical protein